MTSKAANFLPKFKSSLDWSGKKKFRCLKRNKLVVANPEEHVRQRVLNWLKTDKKWPIEYIRVENKHDWYSDKNRNYIRSDIELLDEKGNVKLVIECKAKRIKLTETVLRQAKEYAIKARSKNIWLTNGEDHEFYVKSDRIWKSVEKFSTLGVKHPRKPSIPEFPDVLNTRNVNKFLTKRCEIGDYDFTEHPKEMKQIAMALYKLFFHTEVKLPYSVSGFHILEDLGPMQIAVGNASRLGGYDGWYRAFEVATIGRVETMLFGISWASRDETNDVYGIQINVATLSGNKEHHVLQLSLTSKEKFKKNAISRNNKGKYWEISHNGALLIEGIDIPSVMEALRETGAEHLIQKNEKGKEFVKLGKLHFPDKKFTWKDNSELIVNLLHYGLARQYRRLSHKSTGN